MVARPWQYLMHTHHFWNNILDTYLYRAIHVTLTNVCVCIVLLLLFFCCCFVGFFLLFFVFFLGGGDISNIIIIELQSGIIVQMKRKSIWLYFVPGMRNRFSSFLTTQQNVKVEIDILANFILQFQGLYWFISCKTHYNCEVLSSVNVPLLVLDIHMYSKKTFVSVTWITL